MGVMFYEFPVTIHDQFTDSLNRLVFVSCQDGEVQHFSETVGSYCMLCRSSRCLWCTFVVQVDENAY